MNLKIKNKLGQTEVLNVEKINSMLATSGVQIIDNFSEHQIQESSDE